MSLVSVAKVTEISSQGIVKPMRSSQTSRSVKTIPRSLMTRTMYHEPGRVMKVPTRVSSKMMETARVAKIKEMSDSMMRLAELQSNNDMRNSLCSSPVPG